MVVEYVSGDEIKTIDGSGVPFKIDGYDWEFVCVVQSDGSYNISEITSGLNLSTGRSFESALAWANKLKDKTPAEIASAQALIDLHVAKKQQIKFDEAMRLAAELGI